MAELETANLVWPMDSTHLEPLNTTQVPHLMGNSIQLKKLLKYFVVKSSTKSRVSWIDSKVHQN